MLWMPIMVSKGGINTVIREHLHQQVRQVEDDSPDPLKVQKVIIVDVRSIISVTKIHVNRRCRVTSDLNMVLDPILILHV